ncbi:lipid II-degrading bacteriocin [Burkholderia plantarii]|uniref:Uncharacterized protein n=1 Tax=Burkholderia plantarii TaxID=41899 RepID=A0A0B6RY11_BURPL|nr:lipid II-degrading bacteriocin [Burkholderia plantarii]AJK48278.1 hypothetical protein BGL_2c01820 [Burkholderia plantarii]
MINFHEEKPNSRLSTTRRAFIKNSGLLPLIALLNPKKSWGDINLAPIDVNGQTNSCNFSNDCLQFPFGMDPLAQDLRVPIPALPLLTAGITAPLLQVGNLWLVNGAKILTAAAMGDPIQVLVAFAEGLIQARDGAIRSQAMIYGTFTSWLANGGYKTVDGTGPYGLTASNLGNITKLFGLYGTKYWLQGFYLPVSEFKFYGSPFTTLSSIYYWLFGNGATTTMNLNAMNLDVNINDFGPVFEIIGNPDMGPGTYNIDAEFSFNLFNHASNLWTALVNGRVSGHVVGTLVLNGDESYAFNGEWTLNPDRYEAYPSNRTFTQEVLTSFLSRIGSLGHVDYDILFTGSKEVNLSGPRPSKFFASPGARRSTGGLFRNRNVVNY